MGNAASVIPNKLHTAREAVGHTASTAREALEHTASTAREAVKKRRVHHHRHDRSKVPVLSPPAETVQQQQQQQQQPSSKKSDRETPTIAESKHDDDGQETPPGGGVGGGWGGGGRPPSRGNENNNIGTTAGAGAVGAATSSHKRAGSVHEKDDGDPLIGDAPSTGRGRGLLAPGDKATAAFEGGSSPSRTQDQRGNDVGVPQQQQHRNSRRGEASHSTKNLQQEGKRGCRGGSGGDLGERSSGEDDGAGSAGTTSGSSGGSYTSSSYSSSGSDDSCDDDASDDTFFVPQGQRNDSFNEKDRSADGGGFAAFPVVFDGDRADLFETRPNSEGKEEVVVDEDRYKAGPKAGKSRRKRPTNRHYIKDETMRTLFGLVPFYGGSDGPMDQMVKLTLASVGPNSIDVRDQEGNTLLILACQHACEDLVESILAKGASPTAVNGVGICPLHYTCFADSLSLEAAEALLWRGANPSAAETTYGCTPLHYAASAGDADLCALLVEHGARAQTQDYYTYTAVKYAKDAGHDAIVELLGGEDYAAAWGGTGDMYAGMGAGDDVESTTPSGGLWIRHMDLETQLAYHMNDETGESWWETDLTAVAKDFLAAVPAAGTGGVEVAAASLPPMGVREWLVQEQVRSWLVAIFSRVDPLRLMEVDLVMQIGKADFKGMLKNLLASYGVKEWAFLRDASSPKLESLAVPSLLPVEDEAGKKETDDNKTAPSSPRDGHLQSKEIPEPASSSSRPPVINVETSAPAIPPETNVSTSTASGQDRQDSTPPTLKRVMSSPRGLKHVDSLAVLRAEAEKTYQEAAARHEKELAEERQRQKTVLGEQRSAIVRLEDRMQKQEASLAQAKEESNEASGKVEKLQAALADDSAGQDASDRLSEEIGQLKARVASERVRFSHITEALEAAKGSLEERAAKQGAQEEDRRVRLERLRSENAAEVENLCTEAADALSKVERAWETERIELEQGLTEQMNQASTTLEETVQGAAKVLSEAATTTKSAVAAAKQGAGQLDEARVWMKSKEAEHASSKQIDQTNKQLHTSLRREMERAKQLHNQIEDTKGQARTYARVRPMDAQEKEGGCKEVCLRDGKQTLALLTAEKQQEHWTYTHVFQISSADASAISAGQLELHREVEGLGTSFADGHCVLLMAVGAVGSGKTLTLVGDPEEARATGGFFLAEASSGVGPQAGETPAAAAAAASQSEAKKTPKKGKGKGGPADGGGAGGEVGDGGGGVAAKTIPLAGVFPRLVAEAFATLKHRSAQCAFVVWVSAAAVTMPAAGGGSTGEVVECLLPPPPPPPAAGDMPLGGGEGIDSDSAAQSKDTRDSHLSPHAPPDDRLWGRAVPASSPQEAVAIFEDARSRAAQAKTSEGSETTKHFLSRVRVEVVNRSTKEQSSCEMVVMELAEEKPEESWPAALAEMVRSKAAASVAAAAPEEPEGLLGMVRGCLTDTAKVVTLLCVSPADNHADKTERVLNFGKACENLAVDGASQLKDLKKELARLKKETKGTKKVAPSQLPRPAGGKR